jgi:hypothetical protein
MFCNYYCVIFMIPISPCKSISNHMYLFQDSYSTSRSLAMYTTPRPTLGLMYKLMEIVWWEIIQYSAFSGLVTISGYSRFSRWIHLGFLALIVRTYYSSRKARCPMRTSNEFYEPQYISTNMFFFVLMSL